MLAASKYNGPKRDRAAAPKGENDDGGGGDDRLAWFAELYTDYLVCHQASGTRSRFLPGNSFGPRPREDG